MLPSNHASSGQLEALAEQLAAGPVPHAPEAVAPAAVQAAPEPAGREQAAPGERTEDGGDGQGMPAAEAATGGFEAPRAQPAAAGSGSCALGSWAGTPTRDLLGRVVSGTANALGAGAAAEPVEGAQECRIAPAHALAGVEPAAAAASSAGETWSALAAPPTGFGAAEPEAAPAAAAIGAGEPAAATGSVAAGPEAAPGFAAPGDAASAPEAALADAALGGGCEQLAAGQPEAGRAAGDELPADSMAGAEGQGSAVSKAEPLDDAVATDVPAAAVASGATPATDASAAASSAAEALAAGEQRACAAGAAEPAPAEAAAPVMGADGEPAAGAGASGADAWGTAQLLVPEAAAPSAGGASCDAVDSPQPAGAAAADEAMASAGDGGAAAAAPAAVQPGAAPAAGEPQAGAAGGAQSVAGEPAACGLAAEGVRGAPALTPRKRGRPPKSAAAGAPGTLASSPGAAEGGSPAPRKRGRPPKPTAVASAPATLGPVPADRRVQGAAAGDAAASRAPDGAATSAVAGAAGAPADGAATSAVAGAAGAPADKAASGAAHNSTVMRAASEHSAAAAASEPAPSVSGNGDVASAALACSARATWNAGAAAAPARRKPGRPPKAVGASAPATLGPTPAGGEGQEPALATRACGDDLGRAIANARVVETAEAARVVWARVRGYPFWPVRTYIDLCHSKAIKVILSCYPIMHCSMCTILHPYGWRDVAGSGAENDAHMHSAACTRFAEGAEMFVRPRARSHRAGPGYDGERDGVALVIGTPETL